MRSLIVLLTSCVVACGGPAPAAPAPSTCTDATKPPPPPPPPPPPVAAEKKEEAPKPPKPAEAPAAFKEAMGAAERAIAANDMATADKQIAAAEAAAADDAHLVHLAARMKATRWVYANDFDRAAAALLAVMPTLAKHPELVDEFWAHNTMMMIREAQGDAAAALAENDQATICAARGTWDPENRAKLALQKDRWHRAYLTRMLAETRTGSAKQALVQYAQTALDEYRPIGFPDSIAIVEAYFAALDGKKTEALAAAKRVDAAKNDDEEDLYLVVVGLEAGGDRAGAEAVRKIMRRPSPPRISHAIMLRFLDVDAKKTTGFSPTKPR